ncbi:MAG: peptidoglycan-binding protein [Nannocystaceae bacterium]|nr:peptidoglycan-binding protein [bacterium]
MTCHTVRQGEVLGTIARQYGVEVGAILDAPENDALWQTRSRNVLLEGDEVHVPPPANKSVTLEADRVHTFVFRPASVPVAFRFCRAGRPRRHEPVRWSADDEEALSTHLDEDGWLRVRVPPETQRLRVVLDPDTDIEQTRIVRIGHLDPHVEPVGVQQRLNNLGFTCGAEDGDVAERTQAALELFQRARGLPATGSPDPETTTALRATHGI